MLYSIYETAKYTEFAHFHRRVRVGSLRLGGVVNVRFGAAQLRLAFPPPTVSLWWAGGFTRIAIAAAATLAL